MHKGIYCTCDAHCTHFPIVQFDADCVTATKLSEVIYYNWHCYIHSQLQCSTVWTFSCPHRLLWFRYCSSAFTKNYTNVVLYTTEVLKYINNSGNCLLQ